jgi:hypothetical protein
MIRVQHLHGWVMISGKHTADPCTASKSLADPFKTIDRPWSRTWLRFVINSIRILLIKSAGCKSTIESPGLVGPPPSLIIALLGLFLERVDQNPAIACRLSDFMVQSWDH